MKIMKNIAWTALIGMMTISSLTSCQKLEATDLPGDTNKNAANTFSDTLNCYCIVNPSDSITDQEIGMLNFMREEEKLARDVYLAMYDLYPVPVFRNISKSEQHHMNQVLCLLQHYGLPDPASPDTGIFNNPDLQQLYDDLIIQGSASLVGALTVGAIIEDKDIFDLEADMQLTSNPAILNTFSKLSCASGNHIRAFSSWLENKGVAYSAQYLSQDDYGAIIALPHQFCGAQQP